MSTMPPERREGEPSVRDTASEQWPGVYVASMGANRVRLGDGSQTREFLRQGYTAHEQGHLMEFLGLVERDVK